MNQQELDVLQNSTPTNWENFDKQLSGKSDWDTNRFAGDKALHVRFYMAPRLDMDASRLAQRAIYVDSEYIEIMIPGDKHNIIQRPVWEQDLQRFPEIYEKFKKGVAQVIGTPLSAVPFLTKAQVEEFGFFNIRTVEQLSKVNDAVLGRFMGGQEYKQKATRWLEASTSGEALAQKIEDQNKLIQELNAKLEALSKAAPQTKR